MAKVAPETADHEGVEVIWTIDWTGGPTQLAAAKERHRSGDVCVFDPLTGKFVKRITQSRRPALCRGRLGRSWREEILVISGGKLYIYHNEEPNPDPNRPPLAAELLQAGQDDLELLRYIAPRPGPSPPPRGERAQRRVGFASNG